MKDENRTTLSILSMMISNVTWIPAGIKIYMYMRGVLGAAGIFQDFKISRRGGRGVLETSLPDMCVKGEHVT